MSSKGKGKAVTADAEDVEAAWKLYLDRSSATSDPGRWLVDKNGDLDWPYTAHTVRRWTHDALLTYIWNSAFSIPARDYNPSAPFVHILLHDGDIVTLPHGYRLPLMFVAKYFWEVVLENAKDEEKWYKERMEMFHLSRLFENLFERARAKATVGGMEKGWRFVAFDRLLARFYKHWPKNDPPSGKQFIKEYSIKEYDRDVLKHDWKRWCLRGLNGIKMAEDEVVAGINISGFRKTMKKAGHSWFIDDSEIILIEDMPSSSTSELTDYDMDDDEGPPEGGNKEVTNADGGGDRSSDVEKMAFISRQERPTPPTSSMTSHLKRQRPSSLSIDRGESERADKRVRIASPISEATYQRYHRSRLPPLTRTLAAMKRNPVWAGTSPKTPIYVDGPDDGEGQGGKSRADSEASQTPTPPHVASSILNKVMGTPPGTSSPTLEMGVARSPNRKANSKYVNPSQHRAFEHSSSASITPYAANTQQNGPEYSPGDELGSGRDLGASDPPFAVASAFTTVSESTNWVERYESKYGTHSEPGPNDATLKAQRLMEGTQKGIASVNSKGLVIRIGGAKGGTDGGQVAQQREEEEEEENPPQQPVASGSGLVSSSTTSRLATSAVSVPPPKSKPATKAKHKQNTLTSRDHDLPSSFSSLRKTAPKPRQTRAARTAGVATVNVYVSEKVRGSTGVGANTNPNTNANAGGSRGTPQAKDNGKGKGKAHNPTLTSTLHKLGQARSKSKGLTPMSRQIQSQTQTHDASQEQEAVGTPDAENAETHYKQITGAFFERYGRLDRFIASPQPEPDPDEAFRPPEAVTERAGTASTSDPHCSRFPSSWLSGPTWETGSCSRPGGTPTPHSPASPKHFLSTPKFLLSGAPYSPVSPSYSRGSPNYSPVSPNYSPTWSPTANFSPLSTGISLPAPSLTAALDSVTGGPTADSYLPALPTWSPVLPTWSPVTPNFSPLSTNLPLPLIKSVGGLESATAGSTAAPSGVERQDGGRYDMASELAPTPGSGSPTPPSAPVLAPTENDEVDRSDAWMDAPVPMAIESQAESTRSTAPGEAEEPLTILALPPGMAAWGDACHNDPVTLAPKDQAESMLSKPQSKPPISLGGIQSSSNKILPLGMAARGLKAPSTAISSRAQTQAQTVVSEPIASDDANETVRHDSATTSSVAVPNPNSGGFGAERLLLESKFQDLENRFTSTRQELATIVERLQLLETDSSEQKGFGLLIDEMNEEMREWKLKEETEREKRTTWEERVTEEMVKQRREWEERVTEERGKATLEWKAERLDWESEMKQRLDGEREMREEWEKQNQEKDKQRAECRETQAERQRKEMESRDAMFLCRLEAVQLVAQAAGVAADASLNAVKGVQAGGMMQIDPGASANTRPDRVFSEISVQTESEENDTEDVEAEGKGKGRLARRPFCEPGVIGSRSSITLGMPVDTNSVSEADTDATVNATSSAPHEEEAIDPRTQLMTSSLSLLVDDLVAAKMLSVVENMVRSKTSDKDITSSTAITEPDVSTRSASPSAHRSFLITDLLEQFNTLKEETRLRAQREKEALDAMRQLHSAEVDALRRRLSYLESQNRYTDGLSSGGSAPVRHRSSSSHSRARSRPPGESVEHMDEPQSSRSRSEYPNGHAQTHKLFSPAPPGACAPIDQASSSSTTTEGRGPGPHEGMATPMTTPAPSVRTFMFTRDDELPLPIKSQRKQYISFLRSQFG